MKITSTLLGMVVGLLPLVQSVSADSLFMTNSMNELLRTNTASPGMVMSVGAISGLQTGENLLGIDFRPATGQLFALGSTSRLYTVNTSNAQATQVGAAGAFMLSGTSFGFDFNPTVDRIRVTSNAGQDLRLNPNDGSLTAVDGALNGATSSIVASAYTNSFAGATTTTLYGIDNTTGNLYIQTPPNNGTQTLVGSLGIGGSILPNVAFDIAYPGNIGYATLQTNMASTGLYSINLGTGAASLITPLVGQSITGLSYSAVPEPSTTALVLLGVAGAAAARMRKRASSRA